MNGQEADVQRDMALRIDGIISGARSQLDWLAYTAKMSLDEIEYRLIVKEVGSAMGALYEISSNLYKQFPAIVPEEMIPPK